MQISSRSFTSQTSLQDFDCSWRLFITSIRSQNEIFLHHYTSFSSFLKWKQILKTTQNQTCHLHQQQSVPSLIPPTAINYKFLAPALSAQFITTQLGDSSKAELTSSHSSSSSHLKHSILKQRTIHIFHQPAWNGNLQTF